MIDLNQTRAGLLSAIEAPEIAGDPLSDLTDARIASESARVLVSERASENLFPLLNLALSERFASVPRRQLIRDLLIPLKNALGNAGRHGNGADPDKTISVEIVLTRKGALVAITDEGAGFDSALTFRRFREQESYFVNHGSGFRNLHRAKSIVSYENGGRTFLLCFQPTAEETGGASHLLKIDSLPEKPPAVWAGWLQTNLLAELPEFGGNGARIESCRVYAADGQAVDGCGLRFVVRVAERNGEPLETRVLTGRLHATEAAAAADFQAATWLRSARISKSVLIPQPLSRLAAEPRLVLYDFDPWMNLWEYSANRGDVESIQRHCKRIGRILGRMHQGRGEFRSVEPDDASEDIHSMVTRAATNLHSPACGRGLVDRFCAFVERLEGPDAFSRQQILAPIHGAFGFNCIHYGVDGQTYLFGFEACRFSDRGLDLGGFAADLLCFTLANHDENAFEICRDTLLSGYNSTTEHPIGDEALRLYTVVALSERLRQAELLAKANAGELVVALDTALPVRG